MTRPSLLTATLLGLAVALSVGCHDEPAAPSLGAVEITVSTAGTNPDLDPDGYTLSIDGGPPQAVDINGALTISALPRGRHTVRLGGVATNCGINGDNPLSVNVIGGNIASPASFSVSCFADDGDSGAGDWDY